ncbi:MAG: hypothetical protein RL033_3270 [Pseudomonadota bacterium]
MSRELDRLLRSSLQATPPEALDRIVKERALELVQRQAVAEAARSQRTRAARSGWLLLRRGLRRLAQQVFKNRPAMDRVEPALR